MKGLITRTVKVRGHDVYIGGFRYFLYQVMLTKGSLSVRKALKIRLKGRVALNALNPKP